MPGTPTCGPFSESGTYTTPSGAVIQGTRGPFSSKFAAITYQKTIANSNYNALQINLRRSSGLLEFMVGYTYSKSFDESSSLAEAVNPIDLRLSGALSAFDMRNNFVASYRYRLPIGDLLRREDGWTGGWAISGLTRFTSGFPVTLYNNTDRSLLGTIPNGINNNGVDTPNFSSGTSKSITIRAVKIVPLTPRSSPSPHWGKSAVRRDVSSEVQASTISIWRSKRRYGCPSPARSSSG
jgi:hypothetical protein